MLNLYFGDLEGALLSGNGYFDRQIDECCIETDFGKRVIKEIDGGEVYDRNLIISKVLGGIPPERLSGGTKSLLILMNSDKIIDLASMGDNCLPFLADIAKVKDITVCTDTYRKIFKDSTLDKVHILNDDSIVYNDDEYFEKWGRLG